MRCYNNIAMIVGLSPPPNLMNITTFIFLYYDFHHVLDGSPKTRCIDDLRLHGKMGFLNTHKS